MVSASACAGQVGAVLPLLLVLFDLLGEGEGLRGEPALVHGAARCRGRGDRAAVAGGAGQDSASLLPGEAAAQRAGGDVVLGRGARKCG